jgi:hypothetical protein
MKFPSLAVIDGSSLDPHLRILLGASKQLVSRRRLEGATQLDSLVLLARPLSAASPDARHPGKAAEESPGESSLSPMGFSRLSVGQKLSYIRFTEAMGGSCRLFPTMHLRLSVSRGRSPLVQGFRGLKKPPAP